MKGLVSLGLVLVLLSAGIVAEGHGPPPLEEREPRKLIETVYIWRMTEELDLSEEQISQFFPKLKRLENAEREHSQKIAKAMEELDELLKTDKPSTSALQGKMKELEEIDNQFQQQRIKLQDEIRSVLSVEQQAKLLVFRHRFHREMREILKDIKKHRLRHPGAPD